MLPRSSSSHLCLWRELSSCEIQRNPSQLKNGLQVRIDELVKQQSQGSIRYLFKKNQAVKSEIRGRN